MECSLQGVGSVGYPGNVWPPGPVQPSDKSHVRLNNFSLAGPAPPSDKSHVRISNFSPLAQLHLPTITCKDK